jgi:glycogen debranching enzyme
MSALVQPPLIAQALKRFYQVSGDKLFLYEMLPKVVRYHDWLAQDRDFDGDGISSPSSRRLSLDSIGNHLSTMSWDIAHT